MLMISEVELFSFKHVLLLLQISQSVTANQQC